MVVAAAIWAGSKGAGQEIQASQRPRRMAAGGICGVSKRSTRQRPCLDMARR
jgi:hypothetical protein